MSKIALEGNASGTGIFTLTSPNSNNNRTLTLPDSTGALLTTGDTIPVSQGGTGATSLTANNVILGNGTSAVQTVAPGTNGNVLTSNGTTWTSAAAPTTSTNFGAIGTYAVLLMGVNTNLALDGTIAGSSLRYNWTANARPAAVSAYDNFASARVNQGTSYNGGGTSLSGTWRKLSTGTTYFTYVDCGITYGYWCLALYVRIS